MQTGNFEISPLGALSATQHEQAATILFEAFRENWPLAWPNLGEAQEEVESALQGDRIARAALSTDGAVLGWCSAISGYYGHAWELHPLCVAPDRQRGGIGSCLLADLEAAVAAAGGGTMWLGADDENGVTNLSGVDLYPNVLEKLATVETRGAHPMGFYLKNGYVVTGVIPDGAAQGHPDILMAKRLLPAP